MCGDAEPQVLILRMLESLVQDVRDGTRILIRSPGVSAAAILLMALVVGGNATIYTMINTVVRGRAPGVTAPDLVSFGITGLASPVFRLEDYRAYAAQTRTVRSLAAIGLEYRGAMPVGTPNGSYLLHAAPVTANYFDTIGVRPSLGRTFLAADDDEGATLVGVISDEAWRQYFQRTSEIIGQQVTVDGDAVMIVGVTPAGFTSPLWGAGPAALWIPIRAYARRHPIADVLMIGRLESGVEVPQAQADFRMIQARIRAADGVSSRISVMPYAFAAGTVVAASEGQIVAVVSVVTALTLLIVCANVANLMLGRAVVRQREIAVRQALGATRARIVRVVVVEGLTLAAAACATALTLTSWTARLIPLMLPSGTLVGNVLLDFTPDWRVVVYAILLGLIGTIVFSVAPAVYLWRQEPYSRLKSGEQTFAPGRSRFSSALVVMQLTLSVLLLSAAGLALRSSTFRTIDAGADAGSLMLVRVGTRAAADTRVRNLALLDRIRDAFLSLPNVSAVSYTKGVPPYPWNRDVVRGVDTGAAIDAQVEVVGADFFQTRGLRTLLGRAFSLQDRSSSNRVAVVNRHLAEALWAGASPLGRTFTLRKVHGTVEVVGVVPDAFYFGFNLQHPDRAPRYVLLPDRADVIPADNDGEEPTTFYIRYAGAVDRLTDAVPGALRRLDPLVAIDFQQRLEERLGERMGPARLIARLLTLLACVSLLIAAIGQYAVIAFHMRRRKRDFGVRIALGASPRQLGALVLREAAGQTLVGLFLGFALSLTAATLLRALLLHVTPTDMRTYAGVFVLLAVVSLVACYVPARTASRTDPASALKDE